MRTTIHKIIFIFTLLIFNTLSYSQQVSVAFLDSKSNQPVEQAQVLVYNPENQNKSVVRFTDKDGKVYLNETEGTEVVLTVSFMGYKPFKENVVLKSEQEFKLKEDILNLEQVTVTGTRTPHILKKSPVLTQMISEEEIKSIDAQSLPDILELEMPGMEMSSHGGVPVMNVMGLETQYSLILIDGERLAKSLHKTIDFSRINPANIEKIEIIRGASSALYGSDAMGGVINIITKNAHKKFGVTADIHYQTPNSKDHTQEDIDNADDDYAKKFFKNIDKQNINANLNLNYKGKKLSSSTFFNYKTTDAYKLTNKTTETRYYEKGDEIKENVPDDGIFLSTPIHGSADFTIGQKIGYKISNRWNIDLKGNLYNHHEFDFVNDAVHELYEAYNAYGKISYNVSETSTINLSYNTDIYKRFNYGEKDKNDFLNHQNKYNVGKLNFTASMSKHTLFAEIENLYQTLSTDKFITDKMSDKSVNNAVVVLQDEFNWTKNLMLVAGVRAGFHSAYNFHLSPSLSARYTINKVNLRASYARGFRSPDLKELYMNWSHLGMFMLLGNKNLKPETSNYYSFSADFIDLDKNLNLTLITSFNDVRDKIDGIWANNQKEFRYVNFDNAQIFSVEALVKWQFAKHFKFKTGYIFLKSIRPADAQDLSTMSPMSLNFQLAYKYTKRNYRLSANISGKITGKKEFYVLDEEDTYGHKEEHYKVRYPTYSLWNLTVNQHFGKHIKVGAGVKNLFNYTADIVTFNTSNTPGRRYFVSLAYSL